MSGHTEALRGARNSPRSRTKNWKKQESRLCHRCATQFRSTCACERILAVISRRSVVSVSRLCPVIRVVGLNFDMPERSVLLRIRGRIADRILIPQLFLNLVEYFVQRMLRADGEDLAAGLFRHLAKSTLAASAT